MKGHEHNLAWPAEKQFSMGAPVIDLGAFFYSKQDIFYMNAARNVSSLQWYCICKMIFILNSRCFGKDLWIPSVCDCFSYSGVWHNSSRKLFKSCFKNVGGPDVCSLGLLVHWEGKVARGCRPKPKTDQRPEYYETQTHSCVWTAANCSCRSTTTALISLRSAHRGQTVTT